MSAEDVAWLRAVLDGKGGARVSSVRTAATKARISWRRVLRAKAVLKPLALRHGFGSSGYWTWQLRVVQPRTENCGCCGLPLGLKPMEVAGFGGTVYVRT